MSLHGPDLIANFRSHIPLIAKGDMSRRVLEIQIDQLEQRPNERLVANDISARGGPRGDGNVAAFMFRQRMEIPDFYDYNSVGRTSLHRLAHIKNDAGNYALTSEANDPVKNLTSKLWHHHFLPPARLFVPQHYCPCHRVQAAEELASHACDRHFANQIVSTESGVVSTSIMRAACVLANHFRTWNVGLDIRPIAPGSELIGANAIFLANPLHMPLLLAQLEKATVFKTTVGGIAIPTGREFRAPFLHQDSPDSPDTPFGSEQKKLVLMTRHHYLTQTLTIISGNDDNAVEAVTLWLTCDDAMLALARSLKCRDEFPLHWQLLFCVYMSKGHPFARAITIERSYVLPQSGVK